MPTNTLADRMSTSCTEIAWWCNPRQRSVVLQTLPQRIAEVGLCKF
jgi:hypothetical protein